MTTMVKPRVLFIDDDLGSDDALRRDFCNAIGLTNVTDRALPQERHIADAYFVLWPKARSGELDYDANLIRRDIQAGWPSADTGIWWS
jgi:hypothetical protein